MDGTIEYNKNYVDSELAKRSIEIQKGNPNKIYYYKLSNFLNRLIIMSDSIGNVWIVTGNSSGIKIQKIVERNTTTEVFHYDTTEKILVIKVLQGYGFYMSCLSNLGECTVTGTDSSTEFDSITNVITESRTL